MLTTALTGATAADASTATAETGPGTVAAATPSAAETGETGIAAQGSLIPTAASLKAVRRGLPADPVAATEALVSTIFGADQVAAVSATAEILRRSGLPLVSADGPVVALPDDIVLTTMPVDVEFLPSLTDSVRAAEEYEFDQVGAILTTAGGNKPAVTGRQLVEVLAAWGKNTGAPTASVVAGTAVRALAAARHELLLPSAVADNATLDALHTDPGELDAAQLGIMTGAARLTGLDALQTVLLLAHLAGETHLGVTVGHGSGSPGLRRSAAGVCDDLQLDETQDAAKSLAKNWYQAQLKAAVQAQYGAKAVTEVSGLLQAYDYGTDALATVMFLTGVHVSLTAAHPGGAQATTAETHFRHQRDELEKNLIFRVTASFHSFIPQQQLSCWNLAGLTVPPNGGLEDLGVSWQFSDPQLLKPEPKGAWGVVGDNPVLTATDRDGSAVINTYPKTEKDPPGNGKQEPERTMYTRVTASLSKHDFAVHLKDLVKLMGGVDVFLASEAWKLANNLIQSAGIPTPHLAVKMTYHGSDPYIIRDSAFIWMFPYAKFTMTADYLSCDGPAGPWKGDVTFVPEADTLMVAIGKQLGVTGPSAEHLAGTPEFTLDAKSAAAQTIPMVGDLSMVVTLDPDAIAASSQGGNQHAIREYTTVGDVYWDVNGADMRMLKLYHLALSQGVEFHVVAVPADPGCAGSSPWQDAFDAF